MTATVSDPAGNEGTDSQPLTVDTTAPAVTITGGATALTKDATPRISGTADVAGRHDRDRVRGQRDTDRRRSMPAVAGR